MKFSSAIIIGRFQPLHHGHMDLINLAIKSADHTFIVIGSARSPRQLRNPFTASERIELIQKNLSNEMVSRIHFIEVRDYFYNNQGWTNEVLQKVHQAQSKLKLEKDSTCIVGYEKDETSNYLSWFPSWEKLNLKSLKSIHATKIREAFLRNPKSISEDKDISEITKDWLTEFSKTEIYKSLNEEQKMIDGYKESWANSPYPPVFVTTDNIVLCAEHILLIQRKHNPGKNLWANPGGFLNPNELIVDCAIRELKEETEIGIDDNVLKQSLEHTHVFDHPLRSSRGRTITHAHLFVIKSNRLPEIKASDDAEQALWIPILDVGKMESELFEDHFHIINMMLKFRKVPGSE